jgi:microcystin-dependent protein
LFYHFDVYEVDASETNLVKLGGDSTKSTDVNAVTASDPDAYQCSLTMPAITLASTTSRIKVNIYTTGTGMAGTVKVNTYFGGEYYSFITTTLSASTALLTANNTWRGINTFVVSPTAPTPDAGTNTTALATTAFVDASFAKISSLTLMVPVGTIIMYSGATTPTGYLYCDGTLVSTTTYSQLFSVIGTKYGSGTGTFAVPNFKEKFPLGASNMTTLLSALSTTTGGTFGITLGNLPAHGHSAQFVPGATTTSGTAVVTLGYQSTEVGGGQQTTVNRNLTHTTAGLTFTAAGTVTVQQSANPTSQYYPPFTTINYFIKF